MSGVEEELVLHEVVYRRIPQSIFGVGNLPAPPWNVFRPRDPNPQRPNDRGDVDGLSIVRASKLSAEKTSIHNNPKISYVVVSLVVSTIQSTKDSSGVAGMIPVANPLPDDVAHALIPQINLAN